MPSENVLKYRRKYRINALFFLPDRNLDLKDHQAIALRIEPNPNDALCCF